MGAGGHVEPDGDAVERVGDGRVEAHDEGVVAGDDVIGAVGEVEGGFVALQQFVDAVDEGEGARLEEVLVQVRGVGGDDDPAPFCPDPGHLQPGRMAADMMQREARHDFAVSVVEDRAVGVDQPDHADHVFDIERVAQEAVAHAAACGESHLAVLQVEAGLGEIVEPAGVVEMQVAEDDLVDLGRVDAELGQALGGRAQQGAAAFPGGAGVEAGVDHEAAVGALGDPDEVIEGRAGLVQVVAADEIVGPRAALVATVLDCEKFKWFQGSLPSSVLRADAIAERKDEQ